jgi:hypothetical protein
MASWLITTTPEPDTTQRVPLGELSYSLHIYWSQRCEAWHLDLADSVGAPMLLGVRMVTMFPLLYRYKYLVGMPPGDLVFLDLREEGARPTLEDMGDRFRLYYVTDGEL